MAVVKWLTVLVSLLLLPSTDGEALKNERCPSCSKSCKDIKSTDPNSPSGVYALNVNRKWIHAYCEMGLNGGGYTFLTPASLSALTNADISSIFTDKTSFLLRVRKTDGTQPYAVLRQLSEYADVPLKLGLNDFSGYNAPVNVHLIGSPYLYFGFLPKWNASNNNIQGLQVNGFRNVFKNCDKNPNSHITLYPNFKETSPSSYRIPGVFCNQIFLHLLPNPSGRVMPPEVFLFGETHWGGCGCYLQTNQIPGILGFAIGFR